MSASVIASAVPALLAATLSISKQEEYRYCNPTETNLLTNVGMGATAPTNDAPLAYTDVAFLNEAYDERRRLFTDADTGAPYDVGKVLYRAPGEYQYSGAFSVVTSGTFVVNNIVHLRGYCNPDASLLSAPKVCDYGAANVAAAIVGATNTFVRPSLGSDAFQGETPKAQTVATLYGDLGRLTRAIVGVYADTPDATSNTTEVAFFQDTTRYPASYNTKTEAWNFGGTNIVSNVVENASAFVFCKNYEFYYSLAYYIGKKKMIGWKKKEDSSEYENKTGVVPFEYQITNAVRNITSPVTFDTTGFYDPLAKSMGKANVYAFGTVKYDLGMNGERTTNTTTVVALLAAGLPVEPGGRIVMELSRADVDSVVHSVASLVPHKIYWDWEEFKKDAPDPEDPQNDYSSYRETEALSNWLFRIRLDAFVVVVDDINFRARVLEDGGGDPTGGE